MSRFDSRVAPMNSNTHKSNGFSLVELMVVLVVFGIVVGLAVPTIGGFMRSARLKGAANTVEADLHYARSLASSERKTCAVVWAANSYAVVHFAPPETLRTRTLPRGVTCAASDTASFYAWGLTDPITITISDSHKAQVMHLRTTGKVICD